MKKKLLVVREAVVVLEFGAAVLESDFAEGSTREHHWKLTVPVWHIEAVLSKRRPASSR